MYGHPIDAQAPLRTITLDLPVVIDYVVEVTGDKPPLYLLGPIAKGASLDGLPRTLPVSRSWVGRTVTFTFDGTIGAGTYRVVVHGSRFRDQDGNTLNLVDDQGQPWTGWDLTVLGDPRSVGEELPEQEPELHPPTDPPVVLYQSTDVFLDGRSVTPGTAELSGEVLTVVPPEPNAQVEVRIESLYPSHGHVETLYEHYLNRTYEDGAVHFTSAGPIEDYTWAAYHGRSTEGTIPHNNRRLLVTTPVVRPPRPADKDPLVVYNKELIEDGVSGNRYNAVRYTVTPQVEQPLVSYRTRRLITPETISDVDNTPLTNPRLFPGALYNGDGTVVGPEDEVAVYDLPLASRIYVLVDGQEVWWGQTRLIPLLLSEAAVRRLVGRDINSPADRADLLFQVWRASMEALHFWTCLLPVDASGRSYVPPTMQEYIRTRLAYGWPLEDGVQGATMARVGDSLYMGQSDHLLERRLSALVDLLAQCVETPPLFPEDDLPADVAYLASRVRPTHHPAPTFREITQEYAPLLSTTADRRGQTLRERYDPPQHRRFR